MTSSNTTKAKKTPKKAIKAANMDFEALLNNMTLEQLKDAEKRLYSAIYGFELGSFINRVPLVVLDIPVEYVPSRNETIAENRSGWRKANPLTSSRRKAAYWIATEYLNKNGITERPYLSQDLMIRFLVGTRRDTSGNDTKAIEDGFQDAGLIINDRKFKEVIYRQSPLVKETGMIRVEIYDFI